MKKYCMKATGEEIQFGDMIEMDFTKEKKNGKIVHHHIECKFIPELVELLLEDEVIVEVTDSQDKKDTKEILVKELLLEHDDILSCLVEEQEDIEKRMESLEEEIEKLKKLVKTSKVTKKSADTVA